MVGENTSNFLEFLGGSGYRVLILSALAEQGPLHRDDFHQILDASRTTVTRNLDALIDHGLIERQQRTYRLTLKGQLVTDELVDLIEIIRATHTLDPVLEHLPPSDFEFDPLQLAAGTVTVSTPTDPYAPVNDHVEGLQSADHASCLLPVVGRQALNVTQTQILDHGATHELIVSEDVAETFRSNSVYTDTIDQLLATDRFSIYVFDGQIPFYLGLLDDTVQLGVSDDGMPQALLEVQSADVMRNAREIYYSYRNDSILFE